MIIIDSCISQTFKYFLHATQYLIAYVIRYINKPTIHESAHYLWISLC